MVDGPVKIDPPAGLEVIDGFVRVEFRVQRCAVIYLGGRAWVLQSNVVIVIGVVVAPGGLAVEGHGEPVDVSVEPVAVLKGADIGVEAVGRIHVAQIGLVGAVCEVRNQDGDTFDEDLLAEVVAQGGVRNLAWILALKRPLRIDGEAALIDRGPFEVEVELVRWRGRRNGAAGSGNCDEDARRPDAFALVVGAVVVVVIAIVVVVVVYVSQVEDELGGRNAGAGYGQGLANYILNRVGACPRGSAGNADGAEITLVRGGFWIHVALPRPAHATGLYASAGVYHHLVAGREDDLVIRRELMPDVRLVDDAGEAAHRSTSAAARIKILSPGERHGQQWEESERQALEHLSGPKSFEVFGYHLSLNSH